MKKLSIVLGLILVAGAVGVVFVLDKMSPKPKIQIPEAKPPVAMAVEVEREDVRLKVKTFGTVEPRTETTLSAEVAGKIQQVSPTFFSGGFFGEGDILVQIDPRDYEVRVTSAKAALAQAEVALEMEKAQAEQAKKDWERLGEGEEASSLVLREPQLKEAEANVESAKAALQKAELDLERTAIRAPYSGRVRKKMVDVGQYVTNGTPLAEIYAIDYAEVRLPLSDEQVANLDFSKDLKNDLVREKEIPVILHGKFGGIQQNWQAIIVRTEGEIDPKSRLLYAVARVEEPYRDQNTEIPLEMGLFVEATLLGKTLNNVIRIPKGALHGQNTVYALDDGNRLHLREVKVAAFQNGSVIIEEGLEEGERVVVSPLGVVIEGMKVDARTKEVEQ